MSESMIGFVKKSKLPTVNEFRKLVKEQGLELDEQNETTDLTEVDGCWTGNLKGKEVAFEWGIYLLEVEEREEYIEDFSEEYENFEEALGDKDCVIDFAVRSEADIDASMISFCILSKISDAIFFDANEELRVNSDTCE